MSGLTVLAVAATAAGVAARQAPPPRVSLQAAIETRQVESDADDPALWIDAAHPERSLVLGTNKAVAPAGALAVFDLDGRVLQSVTGLDRPNNVDVEYDVRLGNARVDIAVATERRASALRVWRIDGARRRLEPLGVVPVLAGERGDKAAPMGIALYRRPSDGTTFAIVSPKGGDATGYLAQYRLEGDGAGAVRAVLVRRFGAFKTSPGLLRANEIEAVAVDDALGFVYYADEQAGIRKYYADPDHPHAARELALFGTTGFAGDREGIAIYARPDGTGFIACTDQVPGGSEYRVFRREGTAANPHDHSEVVAVLAGGADATDGLDATALPLGPRFPAGLLVAMNSRGRNFLLFPWPDRLGTAGAASPASPGPPR
jgi:3-phytase